MVFAAVMALFISVPVAARAAVAVSGPGAFVAGWTTRAVIITEGEGVTYANADIAPHNLIADAVYIPTRAERKAKWCTAYDRGRCPLFWSATITAGETTEVLGLERLRSGRQYPFFCSIHPSMKGTMVVL